MEKNKDIEGAKVVNYNQMENCNVFMGNSYGGIFPLPGAQVTVNQNLAPTDQKKDGVTTQVKGDVETQEEREARKERVIEAIIAKLDFSPEQLCYDNQGQRLTNERLGTLFGKVFGMRGAHPSPRAKGIIDQLWVLLIDKRPQCVKCPREDFYRQTVLNVLGCFVEHNLLTGLPSDLANSVFPNTNANEARNISRGVTSNVFPEGTGKHIANYISKLNNGEF